MKWNVTGLVDPWIQKSSLRDKEGLRLVHGLKAHEGACHNA